MILAWASPFNLSTTWFRPVYTLQRSHNIPYYESLKAPFINYLNCKEM